MNERDQIKDSRDVKPLVAANAAVAERYDHPQAVAQLALNGS